MNKASSSTAESNDEWTLFKGGNVRRVARRLYYYAPSTTAFVYTDGPSKSQEVIDPQSKRGMGETEGVDG